MIYFMQQLAQTLLIKIGFTEADSSIARLKAGQTWAPEGLVSLLTIPGDRKTEDTLHKRFADANVAGEWFRPVSALLAYMLEKGRIPPMPVLRMPGNEVVRKEERWPLRIYLAGKITRNDWRESIVAPQGLIQDDEDHCQPVECPGTFTQILSQAWTVRDKAIFDFHSYTGPFFIECGHGCYFDDDNHGVGASMRSDLEFGKSPDEDCVECGGVGFHAGCTCQIARNKIPRAPSVVRLCSNAIKSSDLIFAWIDSPDCCGTIAELGYAAALKKDIWIAGPRRFRDMWFVYEYAERRNLECGGSPADILRTWLETHKHNPRCTIANG